ncbi:MAG: putative ABC transporter permease [Eubacterium sp.]|nr:putative ABC transporter permease [Eubacterium sp.]
MAETEKKKRNKKFKVKNMEPSKKLTFYQHFLRVMWIIIFGSFIGTLMEGIWSTFYFGRWEAHVNTLTTSLCLIYGVGAAYVYIISLFIRKKHIIIQFLVCAIGMSAIELVAGLGMEYILGMRVWHYHNSPFSLLGYCCLEMGFIWGVCGVTFIRVIIPRAEKLFNRIESRLWNTITIIITIILILDLTFTTGCIIRWSHRHQGIKPEIKIAKYMDKHYTDQYMRQKFMRWWFIDDEKIPGHKRALPLKEELARQEKRQMDRYGKIYFKQKIEPMEGEEQDVETVNKGFETIVKNKKNN